MWGPHVREGERNNGYRFGKWLSGPRAASLLGRNDAPGLFFHFFPFLFFFFFCFLISFITFAF
jgi:hypothetical protein